MRASITLGLILALSVPAVPVHAAKPMLGHSLSKAEREYIRANLREYVKLKKSGATRGSIEGVTAPPEECDDGNTVNGDTCDNNCTRPRCGNGEQDPTGTLGFEAPNQGNQIGRGF